MDSWDLEVAIPVDGEEDVDVDHDDLNDMADGSLINRCVFCGVQEGDVNPVATEQQKQSKSEFAAREIFNQANMICRCVHLLHFSQMTQEVCGVTDT